MAETRSKTRKVYKNIKSFSLLELILAILITSIILIVSLNFTYTIYNGYINKAKLRTSHIRLQSINNIIKKRLSLAIKESIQIENNTLIFDSINYTSLLGVFNDNYWQGIFSYDKNTSTKDLLHITNIDLHSLNKELNTIEVINLNSLYIKFNNKTQYYKIACFNCSDINNTIKLTTPNQDINQSSYFSLIKSSYAIKLENETLFLFYNFKRWLQEPYNDKAILINNVKSFTIKTISNNLVLDICLKNNLCINTYIKNTSL